MATTSISQLSKDQLVKTARKLLRKKTPGQEIVNQFVAQGANQTDSYESITEAIAKEKKMGTMLIIFGYLALILLTGRMIFMFAVQLSVKGDVNLNAFIIELAVDVFLSLGMVVTGRIVKSKAKM